MIISKRQVLPEKRTDEDEMKRIGIESEVTKQNQKVFLWRDKRVSQSKWKKKKKSNSSSKTS